MKTSMCVSVCEAVFLLQHRVALTDIIRDRSPITDRLRHVSPRSPGTQVEPPTHDDNDDDDDEGELWRNADLSVSTSLRCCDARGSIFTHA